MAKKDIRKCRFDFCKHDSREIDTSIEPYVRDGNAYYHEDCYESKKNNDAKTDKQKADIQLIKDLWYIHISDTVVFSQLVSELNKLIARGIDSDYLVFVMKYIVNHNLNLHYPAGFKYFVDRYEIKQEYEKRKLAKNKVDIQSFKIEKRENDEPQFKAVTNNKPSGFGDIFKRKG